MFSVLCSKFTEYLSKMFKEAFGGGLGDSVREALEPETVNFLGLQVNPSLFTAFGVTAVLLIFAVIVRFAVIPRFKKIPGRFQMILEGMVSFFDKSSESQVHKHASFVGPYTFTAAVFIALGTLVELFGFRPAFASINTCFAFGIMTFIVINICGFKQKGVLRLKRYLNPINIMTDISVPLSLSLRLFGAIMSGFIIMELVYTMVFTSFVLPAGVAVITTLFHAGIQSYLFATLTNIFVSEAIE